MGLILPGGVKISDATAVPSDVIIDKTFYNNTGKHTGEILGTVKNIVVPNGFNDSYDFMEDYDILNTGTYLIDDDSLIAHPKNFPYATAKFRTFNNWTDICPASEIISVVCNNKSVRFVQSNPEIPFLLECSQGKKYFKALLKIENGMIKKCDVGVNYAWASALPITLYYR